MRAELRTSEENQCHPSLTAHGPTRPSLPSRNQHDAISPLETTRWFHDTLASTRFPRPWFLASGDLWALNIRHLWWVSITTHGFALFRAMFEKKRCRCLVIESAHLKSSTLQAVNAGVEGFTLIAGVGARTSWWFPDVAVKGFA